jgi:hypothetical protein
MSSKKEFLDILAQLDAIHPNRLPVEKLREMQRTIRIRQETLADRANKVQKTATDALEQADPEVLNLARNQATRLRRDNDNLEELDSKLERTIHERTLRETMATKLGSHRRLACLEGLILVLIMLVLGLLVYDNFVADNELRPDWLSSESIFMIDVLCCAVFMGEFFFRLICAESKKYVWKHYWIDFVTSIPIPGEAQVARFGRAARLVRFVRLLRLVRLLRFLRVFFMLWRGMDKLQDVVDIKIMKKTIRWAAFVTLVGAVLIYKIEGIPSYIDSEGAQPPNSVGSAALAMWWSFTTVLTGGFGDIHNPVSVSGQVLTAILVITGMVFVGVFTATLTSLFVGEQAEEIERIQDALGDKIDQLADRLKEIEPR